MMLEIEIPIFLWEKMVRTNSKTERRQKLKLGTGILQGHAITLMHSDPLGEIHGFLGQQLHPPPPLDVTRAEKIRF